MSLLIIDNLPKHVLIECDGYDEIIFDAPLLDFDSFENEDDYSQAFDEICDDINEKLIAAGIDIDAIDWRDDQTLWIRG